MNQFSDTDSVDSDQGIRYKTESIRNKKSIDRHAKHEGKTHRDRISEKSSSRSRNQEEREKKISKSLGKNHLLKERSRKSSSRYKNRETNKVGNRLIIKKAKGRSKNDWANHKAVEELERTEKFKDDRQDKTIVIENCTTFSSSLIHRESSSGRMESGKDEFSNDFPRETYTNASFGRAFHPIVDRCEKTESKEETSSKDNIFGPQLPPHLVKKTGVEANTIGTATVLPSHFITVSTLEDGNSFDHDSPYNKEDEVCDNVMGPGLTPSLQKNEEQPDGHIIGPVLPLHIRRQEDSMDTTTEDEAEVYGPLPDGAHYSQAHIALEERALRIKMKQLEPSNSKQPVREEWMITLPEAKAANFGLGPRQFRAKGKPDLSDRSSWTDTPKDKAHKKEVIKEEPFVDLLKEAERKQIRKRNIEQEKISKTYKKEKESLLEIHKKKLKNEKNYCGTSERRPFTREVDLQVNRFDEAQKKAILKKAQLLDNRFAAGESKFL